MHLPPASARRAIPRPRRGMAVPIVLIFATILGILATFVLRSNTQSYRQNLTSYNQLQATFAARAGMEHALLKVKHLHRELFDGACFAQGRNPLFHFAQPIDLNTNPGPKYCLYAGDATPNSYGFIPLADLAARLSGTLTPPGRWLDVFRGDLVSRDSVMGMSPLPAEVRDRMREPFTGQYDATNIEVLAQNIAEDTAAGRVTNQVVVKVTVQATIETARKETFTEEFSRTVRVARDRAL